MPSLMSLPRELRDQICTHVILARKEAPSLDQPFTGMLNGRESYRNPTLRAWSNPDIVKYSPQSSVAASTPLLLVNRQLHTETLSNLKIIPQAHSYELDIILLKEIVLLPTWLRVPALSTRVDAVLVTFRIAGSYMLSKAEYEDLPRYKSFRGGDRAEAAIPWQIYSVLERFFNVGPTGERLNKSENRKVTIKTLRISVATPPGIDPQRFGGPKSGGRGEDSDPEPDTVLDLRRFCGFIITHVDNLLSMSYHFADYGKIFYEGLDKVVVSLDRDRIRVFDVALQFQYLKFTDSFRWREDVFNRWKEETTARRKRRGLIVLD